MGYSASRIFQHFIDEMRSDDKKNAYRTSEKSHKMTSEAPAKYPEGARPSMP
jgi:hypothetical protein